MLLKWTVLLALAWAVHALIRHRHSRWRLLLWRGILCAALLVPFIHFAPIVVLRFPHYAYGDIQTASTEAPAITTKSAPAAGQPSKVQPPAKVVSPNPVPASVPLTPRRSSKPFSWAAVLPLTWGLGAALAGSRLVWLQTRLNRLRAEARPAPDDFQVQLKEIQGGRRVRRTIALLTSPSVSSSFVCGLLEPAILVPQKLAENLPPAECSVLLAHELAHFYGHDLFWCVAWRWVQAAFWFHPLVWKIPTAHNLACEQEADRLASGELEDRFSYSQLLARLALRMLARPTVETHLVLNGTSQIAQRLHHLQKGTPNAWDWRHSAAGVTLVAVLFVIATGCGFSKDKPPGVAAVVPLEFKKVLVVVQDQDGKPIAGASITPDGFRVEGIHSPDGYGWRKKEFGSAETAITDQDGKAYLKYPVMGIAEEKEITRSLIFSVLQPDYCTTRIQDFSVHDTNPPIRMTRGIPIEVSGYSGADHQPVTELVANLNEQQIRSEDWIKGANGALAFHKMSPGGHLLQLMGRLPSGEIVYSDTVAFTAENGKLQVQSVTFPLPVLALTNETGTPFHFDLELKPGIRLEGRLDDRVPRPVRNGRVMIDVRPKEFPGLQIIEDFYGLEKKYGLREPWHSYRPIAEDGTFVFESVPPGEADLVVLGDGFASKSTGILQNRTQEGLKPNLGLSIPQSCPLVAPVTRVEVATEPTATLDVTATTKRGKPIEGVWVGMYPSVFRMRGMYGWSKVSSEEPFRAVPHLSDLVFSGKTDQNGKLVLNNIPGETRGVEAYHPQYQVPLQDPKGWRDRHLRAAFSAGVTNFLKLVMEPKGTDFIGTSH